MIVKLTKNELFALFEHAESQTRPSYRTDKLLQKMDTYIPMFKVYKEGIPLNLFSSIDKTKMRGWARNLDDYEVKKYHINKYSLAAKLR
jgi:hypothetical protein